MDSAEAMRVKPSIPDGDLFAPLLGDLPPHIVITPKHAIPVRAHTRVIAGMEPPSGFAAKNAALIALEGKAAIRVALFYVRGKLRELYFARLAALRVDALIQPHLYFAYVTADDARHLLHDHPIHSGTLEGPQQWRASIFRKGFIDTGKMVPSLRRDQKASKITAWRCDV